MARGLLVHQVEVDPASHSVLACRVLAPTEWNFHPQGEVARRLARLDPGLPEATLARQVNLLVAAFDPCLPFHIRHLAAPTRVPPTEAHHA
jgi:coenzyme F420-reducing hydrogenase alpha subunit